MRRKRYQLKVWKLVGRQEYDDVEKALEDLQELTAIYGDQALGRVEDIEDKSVINEYYQPKKEK